MKINEKNIKTWSIIGPRATFGLISLDLAEKYDDLMILTADVSTSAGLDRFRKQFPDKYLDIGIAEQNIIGIASGLASEGYKVITTTFAPFQTARCCEQIKVNLGYMKQKVCMVGLASGLVLGTLGYTHCSIEDIGILRSIPNIQIVSPADSTETVKSVEAALKSKKSTYIRLTGSSNNPAVYKSDYKFIIGKSIKLTDGKDLTIFCNGATVFDCIRVSELLKKDNIFTTVINMHTIKPIDKDSIIAESKSSKLIISVEEHNIIGGLGSAISEVISESNLKTKFIRLGIDDTYSKGGSYQFLKDKHGLSVDKIVKSIKKIF